MIGLFFLNVMSTFKEVMQWTKWQHTENSKIRAHDMHIQKHDKDVAELAAAISDLRLKTGHTPGDQKASGQNRRMVESKLLQSMEVMSDGKTGFRAWVDRLINCMAVTYPGSREVMKKVIK